MSATKKINEYISELPIATPETAEALAVSGGNSVKVPLSTFASKDNVKTISEALKEYKEDQGKKDAEQDKRLDKLESGVTTNALQEVSNGIDGEFVETIIGEKNEGQQTIGVSVTIQPISTASEDNRGVAESSDVRNFVNESLEEIDNALEDIINGEINVNILTAGNGVNIANNVISADTTILATKKDIENIKPQQSEQVQSDWNESDLTSKAYIQNKPNLHAVAISGSYNDLTDKPTISSEQVQSDWNVKDENSKAYIKNKPNLHNVATSGSYSDLTNKPTIPSAQVNADWNAISGVAQILNKPTLHTVATSGSYNDLKDKPTINTNFVPYSDNLDAISDDLGVAWMNTSMESREFGHIYKREQGGESVVIPTRTYYITLPEGNTTGLPAGKYYKTDEQLNSNLWYTNESPYYYGNETLNIKVGDKVWDGYGNYYAVISINYPFLTLDNGSKIWLQHGTSSGGAYRYIHESGKYDLWYIGDQTIPEDWVSYKDMRGFGQKRTTASGTEYVEWLGPICTPYSDPTDMQRTTAEVVIGGSEWKDVYDTSSNIPQLADVATSGDYADLANTPHLYVISCELKPTTSTTSGSYDAVMYFNILHNKDTITIDELKSMLLGKRHPATGYKGDDAIVSFVINQYDMSYRTISQENNALIGGLKIHGTYQVF